MKLSKKTLAASILIGSVAQLPLNGCGSTSSASGPGLNTSSLSSGPNASEVLLVSGRIATPGAQLVVTLNSLTPGDPLDPTLPSRVRFVLDDGTSFEMPANVTNQNSLTVVAPFIPSATSSGTRAAEVRLYIVQGEVPPFREFGPSSPINLAELPDTVALPGTVILQSLDRSLASTRTSKQKWISIAAHSGGSFDATRIVASLDKKAESLIKIKGILEKLVSGEVTQLVLGTFQGQPVTLTAEGLAFVDRLLLAYQSPLVGAKRLQARTELSARSLDLADAVNFSFALVSVAAILGTGGTALPALVQGYYIFGAVVASVVVADAVERRVDPFIERFEAAVKAGSQITERLQELGSAVNTTLESANNLPKLEIPNFQGSSELLTELESLYAKAKDSLPSDEEKQQAQMSEEQMRKPLLTDDSYNLSNDRELEVGEPGILGNDFPKGGQITAFDSTTLRGGRVVLNQTNGRFSYVAPVGYNGKDRWSYQVSNLYGTDTAEVEVSINGNALPLEISPTNPITDCSLYSNIGNQFSDLDTKTIQFSAASNQGPVSWSSTAGSISSNGLLRVGRSQGDFVVTASDGFNHSSTNVTIRNGMLTVRESTQWVILNQLVIYPPALRFSISGAALTLVGRTIPLDGTGRPGGTVTSYYRCQAPLLPAGSYHTLEVENLHPSSPLIFFFDAFAQPFSPSGALQPLGTTINGGVPADKASLQFPWQKAPNSF